MEKKKQKTLLIECSWLLIQKCKNKLFISWLELNVILSFVQEKNVALNSYPKEI
jgi:hypothetical protein